MMRQRNSGRVLDSLRNSLVGGSDRINRLFGRRPQAMARAAHFVMEAVEQRKLLTISSPIVQTLHFPQPSAAFANHTDWTDTQSIQTFDSYLIGMGENPANYSLQEVDVSWSGNMQTQIKVENMSTSSSNTITSSVAGNMTATGAGIGTNINVANVSDSHTDTFGKFLNSESDQWLDAPTDTIPNPFGADFSSADGDGMTYAPVNGSGSGSSMLTLSTDLIPFEGIGNVNYSMGAFAISQAHDTAGNFASDIETTATGDVTVKYIFRQIPPPPPNVSVMKTADQTQVVAGMPIGFTIKITNTENVSATGVTLNDLLPKGNAGDLNWSIDASTGNPAAFTITGPQGSQVLQLAGQPITLAPHQILTVHITSPTSAGDAGGSGPSGVGGFYGLGSASQFAVLGLKNTQINNSLVTVNGNEGVSQGGKLTNMAPSVINGNVYEYQAGQYTGPGKLNGSIIISPSIMNQADTDALNEAAFAASLPATQSFSSITSPRTINGGAGVNVVKINGSIGSTVTLNGPAGSTFIINVTGGLSLVGSTGLFLTGGVTADRVLWNFTAASGSIATHVGNVLYGTLLGPHMNFNLDGAFFGEIIGGGGTISMLSGTKVTSPPPVLTNTATVSATNDANSNDNSSSASITITAAGALAAVKNASTLSTTVDPYSASLSGQVSLNGASGIDGVPITVTGTDDTGAAITEYLWTAPDGSYTLLNLRAGTYAISETTPTGYFDGKETLGTAGGTVGQDVFSNIKISAGQAATGYNFSESLVGVSAPVVSKNTVSYTITNNSTSDITLKWLQYSFPTGNGNLTSVAMNGNTIFSTPFAGPNVILSGWLGTAAMRLIGAGQSVVLTFTFSKAASTNAANYALLLNFDNGTAING